MQLTHNKATDCQLMTRNGDTNYDKFFCDMKFLYDDYNDDFMSVLSSAIGNGRSDLAVPLLNEPYELTNIQIEILLNKSCLDSVIEATRILLSKIEPRKSTLNFVLTWACINRQPESIKLIIEAGADINHSNYSPLKNATEFDWLYDDLKTFKLLLVLGAKFSHAWTPDYDDDSDYFAANIFGSCLKAERPDLLMQLINTIGLQDHNGVSFDWQRFKHLMPDYAPEVFQSFELQSVLSSVISEISIVKEEAHPKFESALSL